MHVLYRVSRRPYLIAARPPDLAFNFLRTDYGATLWCSPFLTMNRNRSQISLALTLAVLVSVGFICTAPAQSPTPVGKLPIAQLQKLAESGDPAAENDLGVRYQLGFDVEKNPTLSEEWLHKAAKQGYGEALFNIGVASYNGDRVAGTRRTAMYWFLLAEDAGDVSGKEAVAHMQSEMSPTNLNATYVLVGDGYEKGVDIKQDYVRAMQWYHKAADAGDAAACHRIALLYANGLEYRRTMWRSFAGCNAVLILAILSPSTI